ncbi:WD40-repeat-containing domain protein [Boletus edulis BED1]|uniref:WD40-repeat-containing domain protein n=1 Tax=Boletus edulis BED1 TaxID=1328754 RepID=A0AAD4C8W3_BOLED|nr:WD40-repeat-containing domain protein [Boletus edulis BED1]
MRYRTLEIRWHDSKPISTCDFQPVPFKKARPSQEKNFASQSYKFATGGEDNHVRIWMIHPNILPPSIAESGETFVSPRPPRVEYLATLSKHTASVNVVRFSPNGEHIASAGDDGMIIIWAPSSTPPPSTYGSDFSTDDLQYEKEYWKPRTTFRCTTMQVYDLAWSPSGEYILAGSTDNCARVFTAVDGKCVHEIAEHSHYVQGVAWDPLNEYIATQSSDRSMHIYQISTKQGSFEAHAVGKNTRMAFNHSRTPSTQSRIKGGFKREPNSEEGASVDQKDEKDPSQSSNHNNPITYPPTPATSVASTPSTMFPPPTVERPSSRRSSFSGSNAPSSPAHSHFSRYGRSPSPMPPLPAIRALPSPAWSTINLYGDESFTNFFRRLTFSPDGGLLLTPAGHFEDLSFNAGARGDETPSRGRKGRSSDKSGSDSTQSGLTNPNSTSSVFIYSRANFARPPIAQLPGHKKASVAVRFSPILYELRNGVVGPGVGETKTAVLEKDKEGKLAVDLTSGTGVLAQQQSVLSPSPRKEKAPASQSQAAGSDIPAVHSPSLRPSSSSMATTSKTSIPVVSSPPTGSVFALPYRMLYAVLTMDTVTIYDTQQAGPVCLLTKLHYDEFTDMSWSPDGQTLVLSSRDGYCTLIVFDEILPAHHTQQSTLQLQSIAQHNFVPLTYAASSVPTHPPTPANTTAGLPIIAPPVVPAKRAQLQGSESSPQEQLASHSATDNSVVSSGSSATTGDSGRVEEAKDQPPKKKRRVVLTRVSDIGA